MASSQHNTERESLQLQLDALEDKIALTQRIIGLETTLIILRHALVRIRDSKETDLGVYAKFCLQVSTEALLKDDE